ncbi:MAG: ABC transporter permease [Candidatus Acetothermia bacterium]
MISYISRRLLEAIPTFLAVVTIVFLVIQLAPGDAALILSGAGRQQMDAASVERLREKWGLNEPLHQRYVKYMKNVLTFRFGKSMMTGGPVLDLINKSLPYTLKLVIPVFFIVLLLGVGLGFLAGLFKGSAIDSFSMLMAVTWISIPNFALGFLLMLAVVHLAIINLPISGTGSLAHMILPGITLGARYLALIARVTRSSVLDFVQSDHVRTARAKGLSAFKVNVKHILRAALIPVTTVAGLQFVAMFSNTIIVEKLFSWPGLGHLLVQSVTTQDMAVTAGCVVIISLGYIGINLMVDIFYAYLDPRITYN